MCGCVYRVDPVCHSDGVRLYRPCRYALSALPNGDDNGGGGVSFQNGQSLALLLAHGGHNHGGILHLQQRDAVVQVLRPEGHTAGSSGVYGYDRLRGSDAVEGHYDEFRMLYYNVGIWGWTVISLPLIAAAVLSVRRGMAVRSGKV